MERNSDGYVCDCPIFKNNPVSIEDGERDELFDPILEKRRCPVCRKCPEYTEHRSCYDGKEMVYQIGMILIDVTDDGLIFESIGDDRFDYVIKDYVPYRHFLSVDQYVMIESLYELKEELINSKKRIWERCVRKEFRRKE